MLMSILTIALIIAACIRNGGLLSLWISLPIYALHIGIGLLAGYVGEIGLLALLSFPLSLAHIIILVIFIVRGQKEKETYYTEPVRTVRKIDMPDRDRMKSNMPNDYSAWNKEPKDWNS